MTVASHLQELRRKHEHLSDMVEREQRSPATDALKIADTQKTEDEAERRNHAPCSGVTPGRSNGHWRVPPVPHRSGNQQRSRAR
jgi:hypothetical protein